MTLSQKLLSWLMDPLIPFYSCWHLQKWKEADASQYRTFSIKWLLLLYETVMDKQDTQLLWTSESATLTSAAWLNAAGALELRYEKAAGNETLQQQKSLFDERSAWGEQRSPGLKVTGRKAEVASLCRLTSTRTIWCNLTTSANITTPTGGKKKTQESNTFKTNQGFGDWARLFGWVVKFSAVCLATKVFVGKTQTFAQS